MLNTHNRCRVAIASVSAADVESVFVPESTIREWLLFLVAKMYPPAVSDNYFEVPHRFRRLSRRSPIDCMSC
jgi:hypothetical protein